VNAPSLRSPKWRSRIVLARSESVPGTENSFESSELRCVNAKAPARSTTSQPVRIGQRNRNTTRVQRSIKPSATKLAIAGPHAGPEGETPQVGLPFYP
jgi:hypothetical protein